MLTPSLFPHTYKIVDNSQNANEIFHFHADAHLTPHKLSAHRDINSLILNEEIFFFGQ